MSDFLISCEKCERILFRAQGLSKLPIAAALTFSGDKDVLILVKPHECRTEIPETAEKKVVEIAQ